jgi:hypothetical protein
MNRLSASLLAAAGLFSGAFAPAQTPALPPTPAAAQLVRATPFRLAAGYASDWRKERPLVTEGWLVVLRVDPALVFPRQTAEPVLYAGRHTAERLNVGYRSGHVVAIVPAPFDPAKDPVWFGAPALPEQVDAATIAAERAKADAAGIAPAPAAAAPGAAAGRPVRALAAKGALLADAAALVREFAPDEPEAAAGLAAAAP